MATAPPDVLVVDDDQDVRASLERGLRLSGFTVRTAADGEMALDIVRQDAPACLVLDVNMPGIDGVEVVRRLRATGVDVPVCMLSARGTVGDRVAGLEAGADDYLVKPFALEELVARLRALLRRTTDSDRVPVQVAELRVDPARRQAWCRGQLLELVWGYDFATDTNVVDVFVGYLRRKLEVDGAPRLIHTVRGVGFVLREERA
jgi:two-component system response regulator PrrA